MPPPQLPRNAPVVDVVHPVQINLLVVFRNNRDLAVLDHLNRPIGQRLDLDEPLCRKPRFYNGSATIALADRDGVVLLADQKVLRAQVFEHTLARGIAAQSRVRAGVLVHVSVLVHDVDLRQVVPQASLKVVGIVRRRHLHRAGPELRVRQFVGDDRNLPIHQRQQNFLPVQMLVAFVLLVHRDRRIAQHRLGTGGRHGDELVRPNHRIADLVQLALALLRA